MRSPSDKHGSKKWKGVWIYELCGEVRGEGDILELGEQSGEGVPPKRSISGLHTRHYSWVAKTLEEHQGEAEEFAANVYPKLRNLKVVLREDSERRVDGDALFPPALSSGVRAARSATRSLKRTF